VRLFVAVWPDAQTRRHLASLELTGVRGVRRVEPDEWHVTLRFVGDVDDQAVPLLVAALETAAGQVTGRVRCRLGPSTAWFPGQRVLQIPVTGLDGLAVAVRTATEPFVPGPGRGGPPFTGHLTVARSGGRRPDAAARAGLAGIPVTGTWAVDSIDLVQTRGSAPGPRYAVLARVPLVG
jgi:RNA 2',3'-cyclic 3'-phosphodiesterase